MAERVFDLPDLGEGLEEAVIATWLVAEGDDVTVNQPLVEVETAKAAVEIPSPYAGRIARLHAEAGGTLAVGAPLVTFEIAGAPGETARTPVGPGGSVATTPAVRKLAKDLGVDLAVVSGSGPGGRINRKDVEAAAAGGEVGGVSVSATRRAIAENLARQAAIPQVTTFRTVDCSALDGFRRELGVSPLPVLVAALARTVRDHPMLNSGWAGDRILMPKAVHVGVAADTERGLVVPVLHDAHELGIAALATEIGRLGEGARAGTLAPQDLADATIAVSNTGSYGSEAGTPILSPGTAVTLAIGVIAPRALVVDGRVEARPACTLSCTFDHRVLDGATIGRALTDLVALLQDPTRLAGLPR